MTAEKLPEWPEQPECNIYGNEALDYVRRERDAYRKRMEALAEFAREVTCENVHHTYRDYHDAGKPCPVMIRLHALLAACERKEAGR